MFMYLVADHYLHVFIPIWFEFYSGYALFSVPKLCQFDHRFLEVPLQRTQMAQGTGGVYHWKWLEFDATIYRWLPIEHYRP